MRNNPHFPLRHPTRNRQTCRKCKSQVHPSEALQTSNDCWVPSVRKNSSCSRAHVCLPLFASRDSLSKSLLTIKQPESIENTGHCSPHQSHLSVAFMMMSCSNFLISPLHLTFEQCTNHTAVLMHAALVYSAVQLFDRTKSFSLFHQMSWKRRWSCCDRSLISKLKEIGSSSKSARITPNWIESERMRKIPAHSCVFTLYTVWLHHHWWERIQAARKVFSSHSLPHWFTHVCHE